MKCLWNNKVNLESKKMCILIVYCNFLKKVFADYDEIAKRLVFLGYSKRMMSQISDVIISFSLFHSRETGKLYSGLGAPLSN
jgi:hypothetical protein